MFECMAGWLTVLSSIMAKQCTKKNIVFLQPQKKKLHMNTVLLILAEMNEPDVFVVEQKTTILIRINRNRREKNIKKKK